MGRSTISFLVFICIMLTSAVTGAEETKQTGVEDVVVLLQLKKNVKVEEVRQVVGTSMLFRVNLMSEWASEVFKQKYRDNAKKLKQRWDYMAVGKGFASGTARDEYTKKMSGLCDTHLAIPLTTNPKVNVKFLNTIIENARKKEDLAKRPLEASLTIDCGKLVPKGAVDGEKIFVISFTKYNNKKLLKQYAGRLLTKVFPALGTKYFYSGKIPGEDWDWLDAFSIMDFVDKKTWCEYARSKLVKENKDITQKAFHAAGVFTGVMVQ